MASKHFLSHTRKHTHTERNIQWFCTHTHTHTHVSIVVIILITVSQNNIKDKSTTVVTAISAENERPHQAPHQRQKKTEKETSIATVVPLMNRVLPVPRPVGLSVKTAVTHILWMATALVLVPPTVGIVHVGGTSAATSGVERIAGGWVGDGASFS